MGDKRTSVSTVSLKQIRVSFEKQMLDVRSYNLKDQPNCSPLSDDLICPSVLTEQLGGCTGTPSRGSRGEQDSGVWITEKMPAMTHRSWV